MKLDLSNMSQAEIVDRVKRLAELRDSDINVAPWPEYLMDPKKFEADQVVVAMDMAGRGMHLSLMNAAWSQQHPPCSLPDDDHLIRGLCHHPRDWWTYKRMLFSDKNGGNQRAWFYRHGRWWSVGLCKAYLRQAYSRLRKQKGGFTARAKADPRAQEIVREIEELLAFLGGDRVKPEADQSTGTSVLWEELVEARANAHKELGEEVRSIRLTPARSERLEELKKVYGESALIKGFHAVTRSDWHMGRSDGTPKLSFSAFTTEPQPKILIKLARSQQPKASSGFKPKPNPSGVDNVLG